MLKVGPICCPEVSVTYLCHTTSQKSEGLNYTMMEAWNLTHIKCYREFK